MKELANNLPSVVSIGSKDASAQSYQSQSQLLSVMHEINKKLLSGASYKKLLDLVFESLDLVIPYDRIGIALIEGNDRDTQLSMKWVRSKIAVNHLNLSYSAPIAGSSLQEILTTGKPRVINDLIEYSERFPSSLSTKLIIRDGIRSSLTCPLRSGDQQIGVVFFSSCKADTYRTEHVKTFLEVADELSMIVHHGRLRHDFDTSKAQTRNLNMILHDLKSPLSTIQGFAESSFQEPWFKDLDDDGKEVFQVFLRNSKYMFDLLSELAEIGELDRHEDQLSYEDVDLQAFVQEMIHFGKVLAEAKDINFEANVSLPLQTSARFDRHQLRRVLDNLFSNAVKYSGRRTKISFAVTIENDRIKFEVSDSGIGMLAAELPKLFREFGKTSSRPTEGESSTGLGLAIVKRIIDQHSGAISVQSDVGRGSKFTVWIPILRASNNFLTKIDTPIGIGAVSP